MRSLVWLPAIAVLLLVCQAGYGANNRPPNELPIPQLRNAPSRQARPDLVVRSLSVRDKGPCEAGRTVITFNVVVANTGNSPFPAAAGAPIVVKVIDRHNSRWGGKTDLKETIPPGASVTVAVQVPFLLSDPAHMAVRAPHPFTAFIAPGGLPDTLPRDNSENPVVGVSLWENCPGRNP